LTFINKGLIIKKKTMYLNVILTIFIIVQIAVCGCIIYWWKKYGKTLFKTFTELKNVMPMGGMNPSKLPDMGKMPDISQVMKQFENFYGKK
jgi:hypothetical protein